MDAGTKKIIGVLAGLTVFGFAVSAQGDETPTKPAAQEAPAVESKPKPKPAAPKPEPKANEGDASARLACDHFRNVARDAADGIMNDAELREKLKEINDDAWVSDVPGIAEHAKGMLAALTSGGDMTESIEGFGEACRSIGH